MVTTSVLNGRSGGFLIRTKLMMQTGKERGLASQTPLAARVRRSFSEDRQP